MSQRVELYIVYVQLIYLVNLIFNSNSAHLIHEPCSRVNYRIELQIIHELAQVIANPTNKL
jgi:hypothetical protein